MIWNNFEDCDSFIEPNAICACHEADTIRDDLLVHAIL